LIDYFVILNRPNTIWVSDKYLDSNLDSESYSPELIIKQKKVLESGLNLLKLKDIVKSSFITGSTPKYSDEVIKDGAVLLKTVNIDYNNLNDSKFFYISKEDHENKLKRSKLVKNDLVITVIGATEDVIGRTIVYRGYPQRANITQSLCKFSVKEDYDAYYISTFLNCKYGHALILRKSSSSTRKYINNTDLGEIVIPIPSPEIQKYIGDKVRRAEELREEARRLKKIAEDIVKNELRLDELRIKLKNVKDTFGWQGPQVLTARIDSSYYNQKYLLKEEFLRNCQDKFVMLNELVEVVFTGKKPSKVDTGEEIFFIQSGDISTNFMELNTKVKVDINKSRLVEYGDLLFAKDGETIGKIAVNYSTKKSTLNEHTYCIRLKKKYRAYASYIYYLLINDLFNDLIRREATGSAQKGLNQDFLERIVIPIISEEKILQLKELEEDRCKKIYQSKELIQQAKQDVEDLIEGKFDMSKLKESAVESR